MLKYVTTFAAPCGVTTRLPFSRSRECVRHTHATNGTRSARRHAPRATGGTIDTHTLSEYTERGWAVVVFYPFDFHPACTDQWCSLRDPDWLTLLDDVVLLGIGADVAYSHREYAAKHNVGVPSSRTPTGGE